MTEEVYAFEGTVIQCDEAEGVVKASLPDGKDIEFFATPRKWDAMKERVVLHGYLAACLDIPYSQHLKARANEEPTTPLEQYEEKAVKAVLKYINLAKQFEWEALDKGEQEGYNTGSDQEE